MSDLDEIEAYAHMSLLKAIRDGLPNGSIINSVGMRPKNDAEEWYDFSPMGDVRMRTRRGVWGGILMWQVACCSKLEEAREDKDTLRPFRMASGLRTLIEKKDIPIRTIGVAPEPVIGTLQMKEARQSYLPRRNITFQGEGNFAVEQGNSHSVVVTFQAVLIASA